MGKKRTHNLPSITLKALEALKNAAAKVVKEHRRLGLPLIVWEHGKIVKKKLPRLT
jgi:hypothetical protein